MKANLDEVGLLDGGRYDNPFLGEAKGVEPSRVFGPPLAESLGRGCTYFPLAIPMMKGSTTMRTSLRVAMFGAEFDEAALRTWSQGV